jgi:hypothetical protein
MWNFSVVHKIRVPKLLVASFVDRCHLFAMLAGQRWRFTLSYICVLFEKRWDLVDILLQFGVLEVGNNICDGFIFCEFFRDDTLAMFGWLRA